MTLAGNYHSDWTTRSKLWAWYGNSKYHWAWSVVSLYLAYTQILIGRCCMKITLIIIITWKLSGTLTEEVCENGLVFDGYGDVHNHCNYNWAVDCGKRVYDDTPISSPGCLYQFGLYPVGEGCQTTFFKVTYIDRAHQAPVPFNLDHDLTWSNNFPII